MVLVLELTPEMEEHFREGVAHQDLSQVKNVLTRAVENYLESFAFQPAVPMTEEEWDREADALTELVDANIDSTAPVLSDFALTRESIYGDHP